MCRNYDLLEFLRTEDGRKAARIELYAENFNRFLRRDQKALKQDDRGLEVFNPSRVFGGRRLDAGEVYFRALAAVQFWSHMGRVIVKEVNFKVCD